MSSQPTKKSSVRSLKKPILPWLGLSIIWILLDQITKLWVQSHLEVGHSVDITPWFSFVHVLNPGAAFSFLASQEGWQKLFLSGIAVLASVVILFIMRTSSHRKFAMFCLAGILGGALGNLIDRTLYGAVVDFLDIYWGQHHWPAFNIADVAISTGAVGLIIDEMFFKKTPHKQ